MSRLTVVLLVLAALSIAPPFVASAEAQVCPGTIVLDTQADVDAFACTEVGTLFIGGTAPSDITDLSPLTSLSSIEKLDIRNNPVLESLAGLEGVVALSVGLDIENNDALASLVGLDNLASITGGIDLIGNDALESLTGLGRLTSVGGSFFIGNNAALSSLAGPENLSVAQVTLADNDGLESLEGIAGFTSIGFLALIRNQGLTSLTGFGALTVGDLQIDDHDGLSSLAGLESLTAVENLFVRNNVALTSLAGLENLVSADENFSITNNDALASLAGLEGLTFVGENLTIGGNDVLVDCACGLAGLISDGAFVGVEGDVIIQNNAPGGACASPEDVLGAECTPVASEDAAPATGYALSPVWPNPTTGRAALALSVERPQRVTAEVLDVLGRRVAVLFDGVVAPGVAQILVLERGGQRGGHYVVRVRGETFAASRRVNVLR